MKKPIIVPAVALTLLIALTAWALTISFGPSGPIYLRHLSLLFAAMGLSLLLFQFVLVSRVRLIEEGTGLDRLLGLHRFFGRTALALLTVHLALIAAYRLIAFGELFPTIFIWAGLTALIGFSITGALASINKKLGLAYETWRGVHLVNYLLFPLAMVHVFYHSTPGSPLYYFWLLLAGLYFAVILFRITIIAAMKKTPYTVVKVKREADNIWSLHFSGPEIDHKPGQFMFLQLLRKGRLSSPHPFTISSAPGGDTLSVTPKELGDFTATIKATAVGDKAYIDAPYGIFSFLNFPAEKLVFIAGGIGITPFISMLRYMSDRGLKQNVTLFWANSSENSVCFREELQTMQKEISGFKLHLVITSRAFKEERLDANMIESRLGGLEGREFFVCGPPAMSAEIIADLKNHGVPPRKIHSELFEL